ncbi:MAG: hypothetical protein AABZ74_09740 [Cyanobacteriota bacterium]
MVNTTLIEHYNEILKNIELLLYKLKNNDYENMPVLMDKIMLHLSNEEQEKIGLQSLSVMLFERGAFSALEASLEKISQRFQKIRDSYSNT